MQLNQPMHIRSYGHGQQISLVDHTASPTRAAQCQVFTKENGS
jgi:hypothetical protein